MRVDEVYYYIDQYDIYIYICADTYKYIHILSMR